MSALRYLDSFINFEHNLKNTSNRDFQLDRMHALLSQLGDPQQKLKAVQIAGSKGKGSTSIFLAEILRVAGYRVGLYTSPHFDRVNERIRILSQPQGNDLFDGMISDDGLDDLVARHQHTIDAMRDTDEGRLTFYEVFTALAFCYFAEQKVDIVILETGLGGRLDATNTAQAILCGITPISLEHTHILGDTLGAIASEKAGIIKDGQQRVVIGKQPQEAADVIKQRCASLKIKPNIVEAAWYGEVHEVALKGLHQQDNAAMAMQMASVLNETGLDVDRKHMHDGIHQARWPGRFEVIPYQGQDFVLDGAHNDASLTVLQQTLDETFSRKKRLVILGVSSDKDVDAIVDQAQGFADMLLVTRANHPRSFDFSFYRGRDEKPTWVKTANVGQAMGIAAEHYADHVVIVTGSLFLVAEARRLLV